MKKGLLLLVGLLFFNGLFAQVTFRDLTLEEALKVAEKEGKLVFLDFTAPWCCGCKLIEAELKEATEFGRIMNALFVSIQADVDTEYGRKLRDQYVVPSLPTYLFIRPDGTVQHQFGSGSQIEYFVKKFWRGLDPYRNYLYYKTKYDAGNRDVEFLKEYIECLGEMGWDQVMEQVKGELWDVCSDQQKLNSFSLFFNSYLKESSKEFQFLLAHRKEFFDMYGNKTVANILRSPVERQLEQVMKQDTVWSKSELKALEKAAIERECVNEVLKFKFALCNAICSGQESELLEIFEGGLHLFDGPFAEREKCQVLANCSRTAKDSKVIESWIALCKKQLPTLMDGMFGAKKSVERLIKELEGKL